MAAVVDLVGVKNAIKSLLDTANTTTASPIYLSNGLTNKVQKVLTVHPLMVMPQASYYPFVTCYVTDKSIQSSGMAANALTVKRKAELSIDVVGGVWCNNVTDDTKDAGDDQILYLMENVEMALRAATAETFTGKITFETPDRCQYFTSPLNEENSVRAGILTLKATVYY